MVGTIVAVCCVFICAACGNAEETSNIPCGESKCPACCPHSGKCTAANDATACDKAGLNQSAARRELLREKLAARDKLQREIDDLQAELKAFSAIYVEAKLLEVDRKQMRQAGFDLGEPLSAPFAASSEVAACCSKEGQSERGAANCGHAFIEFLRNNRKTVRVISEPTLVVSSGRRASFFCGGEIPIATVGGKTEVEEIGTRLDVVAHELSENRVRLEFHQRVSDLDEKVSGRQEREPSPRVHVIEMSTTYDLPYGQTAILAGPILSDSAADKQLLSLIRIERSPPLDSGIKPGSSIDEATKETAILR